MTVKINSNIWTVGCTNYNQIAVMILLSFFYKLHKKETWMDDICGDLFPFNQCRSWVIMVNFDQGKQNLVQVSGEFELSEFDYKFKWLKSGLRSKGKGTYSVWM